MLRNAQGNTSKNMRSLTAATFPAVHVPKASARPTTSTGTREAVIPSSVSMANTSGASFRVAARRRRSGLVQTILGSISRGFMVWLLGMMILRLMCTSEPLYRPTLSWTGS